jgi:hexosaminidase
MRYSYFFIVFITFLLTQCTSQPQQIEEIAIIPKPLSITTADASFVFDGKISLETDEAFVSVSEYFVKFLKEEADISTNPKTQNKKVIFSRSSNIDNDEEYHLNVSKDEIRIEAKTKQGAFYAVQSFLQLFPAHIEKGKPIAIPSVDIKDAPRFRYRGMHLDVARHMYSVEFIKKYIDMMSRLKLNTFHWHLTEDQGWRIEIKKYPKLQEIAAYRKETLVGHYNDQPHQFDGKRYGGFYTQKQIRDVVAYAEERHVTIIPEIEMPGHSQAAIAAYPELGCSGKELEVATKWGVFEEVYCPTEFTFQFLEDVIDEVVELFPGKYIHIGGDEAPKTRWKNCDHCQQLIKEKGLKDEHELQSYFIQRMETYINSKGKQIIGWDEILEGGLAPNATVMSWRGTKGAIEAAKEGHDVILTPTSHCYFDYYQSDNENEPLAIGGFLPLEKVYSFEPIPSELTKDESKHVLGAQGNVWTEYMPTEQQVEYMAFPRMIALSEVVWSTPDQKNYTDFVQRLEFYQQRLDAWNVNYANHIYEVKGELKKNSDNQLSYELTTVSDSYPIYYSTDGTKPSVEYTKPISVDSSMTIKAIVKNNNKILGNLFQQEINLHKGVGAKITIDKKPHPSYNAGGKEALINGISGNNKRFGDKEWLGFSGEDIEIKIQFDEPTEINSISTRFHNGNGQWIYAPKSVGLIFTEAKRNGFAEAIHLEITNEILVPFSYEIEDGFKKKFTEIKLIVKNYGKIPEGRQGAGFKAWTFIDEIIIE